MLRQHPFKWAASLIFDGHSGCATHFARQNVRYHWECLTFNGEFKGHGDDDARSRSTCKLTDLYSQIIHKLLNICRHAHKSVFLAHIVHISIFTRQPNRFGSLGWTYGPRVSSSVIHLIWLVGHYLHAGAKEHETYHGSWRDKVPVRFCEQRFFFWLLSWSGWIFDCKKYSIQMI